MFRSLLSAHANFLTENLHFVPLSLLYLIDISSVHFDCWLLGPKKWQYWKRLNSFSGKTCRALKSIFICVAPVEGDDILSVAYIFILSQSMCRCSGPNLNCEAEFIRIKILVTRAAVHRDFPTKASGVNHTGLLICPTIARLGHYSSILYQISFK